MGGLLRPYSGRFTHGNDIRHLLYRMLGGLQDRSGGVRKISPLSEFDPRTSTRSVCHIKLHMQVSLSEEGNEIRIAATMHMNVKVC